MLDYDVFKTILNKKIFGDDKFDLFKKISESPQRYIGLFRPTKPKAKLFQNLLQSHEIKFGDALENIFEEILKDLKYTILPKTLSGEKGRFKIDQLFKNETTVYFVEQKVRDDHDSSKKEGQIRNFEKKLNILLSLYSSPQLVAIMYFVDPDLSKNKRYYKSELKKMSEDYGIKAHLFYGGDFLKFLKNPDCWKAILNYLKKWKEDIPEFPEIDFDKDPKDTFDRLKNIRIMIWRKFIENDKLWEEGIVRVIFNNGASLRMMLEHFENQKGHIYETLSEKLSDKIKKYYNQ